MQPAREDDLRELMKLNADYLSSDQYSMSRAMRNSWCRNSRVSAGLQPLRPDGLSRNNFEAKAVKDLESHDVRITLIGDVALVHARMTLKTLSAVIKHGRYTDEYLRRDGKWWCIGANVISENIIAWRGECRIPTKLNGTSKRQESDERPDRASKT